eukprot:6084313-Pyramimonas_sp.AAC.1
MHWTASASATAVGPASAPQLLQATGRSSCGWGQTGPPRKSRQRSWASAFGRPQSGPSLPTHGELTAPRAGSRPIGPPCSLAQYILDVMKLRRLPTRTRASPPWASPERRSRTLSMMRSRPRLPLSSGFDKIAK